MPTPILQLPLVEPNQNQKEATINTSLAILEAASNDSRVIDASTGSSLILSQDLFTRNLMQRVQGNTDAFTVRVPALKRFFVVAAEGTGPVTFWPQGGSPTINGAEVPAGTISLLVSDGVNIRALSSGVTRLQDLTDVITTPVANGQVLAYILAEDKWRPATMAEVLNVAFTGLTDTPSNYTGAASHLIRVNAAGDGIEFVAAGTIAGAKKFTELSDTPESFLGHAGHVPVVNDTMTGLVFEPPANTAFTTLSDAPASYVGAANKAVFVDELEGGLIFRDVGEATGSGLIIKDEGEEVLPSVGTLDFAGEGVSVTPVGSTGVLITVDTALTQLTDAPDTYVGQKKKLVAVKDEEDGIEFVQNQNTSVLAAKTASHTLVIEDAFEVLPFDSVTDVALTIPAHASVAFPINTQITALAMNTGKVVFSNAPGVTIVFPNGTMGRTRAQWSTVMAVKIATNTWVLMGDLGIAP